MGKYILSFAAEADLEKLLEYGIENFGLTVAITYYDGLVCRFKSLAASPFQYPAAENIREGYRLCVYKSHSVYFRCVNKDVEIVRILNGQDIEYVLQAASII
ncbi:MAG: toxin ParE1/3/4 [Oleiphilaceae bacterium]|jgi:toxin ParE1/3/4